MSIVGLFCLALFLGAGAFFSIVFSDVETGFNLWFWRMVAVANAGASMVCIGLAIVGLMQ